MITVGNMMSTELYTLKETDSILAARQIMTDNHIRHIPVVDDHGHLVGLVTQRDILAAIISSLADVGEIQRLEFETSVPINQLMQTELVTVHERMGLREAALRMQQQKYGCLPVVSNGQLKGIITDSDFVAVAINLLEQLESTEPVDLDLSE